MAILKATKQVFSNFLKDKRGNIAILAAFALLPIMISVGAAIDYSRGARVKSKIAQSTDVALLSAAASVMKEGMITSGGKLSKAQEQKISAQLYDVFGKFFHANMGELSDEIKYKITYDSNTQDVKVDIDLLYKTAFGGFLTPNIDISVVAKANMKSTNQGALSMYLVLDKSGSMGWQNRMNILKVAIADMAIQFEETDPKHEYVRLGAIAYDSDEKQPTKLEWGAAAANLYVQSLQPGGGTNSSSAMSTAYQDVVHNREDEAHADKNKLVPKKYIVLLTDGSNNKSEYDTQTLKICDEAKNAAVEVYAVAFQAPASGQQLLKKCASSAQHYFNATNANDLINAFRYIGSAASKGLKLTH